MLVFFLVFCLHICLVLFNLNHNALTDCMWQIFFAWNYFVRLHIILKGTLQHLLWKVWNVSGIKGHHLTNPLQQTFFECTLFQKSNWQPNASTALPLLPFPPFFFFFFCSYCTESCVLCPCGRMPTVICPSLHLAFVLARFGDCVVQASAALHIWKAIVSM